MTLGSWNCTGSPHLSIFMEEAEAYFENQNSEYKDDDVNIQQGAGSCRLKRRCAALQWEGAGCNTAAATTRPRSCHGSSPGGTATRAVHCVHTWVTVGQLCLCLWTEKGDFQLPWWRSTRRWGSGTSSWCPRSPWTTLSATSRKGGSTFSSWPSALAVEAKCSRCHNC